MKKFKFNIISISSEYLNTQTLNDISIIIKQSDIDIVIERSDFKFFIKLILPWKKLLKILL